MDHGGHGGHGGMTSQCKTHMLWNTQIIDTCVVFSSWHIGSYPAFAVSFLAIAALGVLYEYLRLFQRNYDQVLAARLAGNGKVRLRSPVSSGRNSPDGGAEEAGVLNGRRAARTSPGTPIPPIIRLTRALLYGATVFLSFFLMLVFMTYNAYLILAVVLGASIGHYIFNPTISDAPLADAKGMACH